MKAWLQRVLMCPACGGELDVEVGALDCRCGADYPIVDGIPVFVDGVTDDEDDSHTAGHQDTEPPQIPAVRRVLDSCSGRLHLDVGCGTGRNISFFNGQYLGCDRSLTSVRTARDRAESLELDAAFICGDARNLPLVSRTFDVVLSSEVIEHVPPSDRDAFVTELTRARSGSGISVVSAPTATEMGNRLAWLSRRLGLLDQRSTDEDDHPRITVGELKSLGFETHGCLDGPAHDALASRGLGPVATLFDRLAWRVPFVATHAVGIRRGQHQSS